MLRVTRVTCLKMQRCRHLRCCASRTRGVMQSCRNLSSVTRVTCHKLRLRGRVSQAKRLQCYTCHVPRSGESPRCWISAVICASVSCDGVTPRSQIRARCHDIVREICRLSNSRELRSSAQPISTGEWYFVNSHH